MLPVHFLICFRNASTEHQCSIHVFYRTGYRDLWFNTISENLHIFPTVLVWVGGWAKLDTH